MPSQSSLGSFIIQNHRGAGDSAAENTLEAFEYSWNLGMYPESDLRTTRDGVIVPFHDNDFSRVVRDAGPELAKKGVADVTWDELVKLDIGGERFPGRHVSRLTEVFEQMRGQPLRRLYMDIKQVDLEQVAAHVRAYGIDQQVILASNDYEVIRRWKALAPNGQTMMWMGLPNQTPGVPQVIEQLRAAGFAGLSQLQTHVHLREGATVADADPFTLADQFITNLADELEDRGILYQALPWRISDPAVYRRLLDLGVKSFATNFPEVTLEVVLDYYNKQP